ncbi:unnamed protein product [Ostreobium quekettii]|uniref:Uncharacterized protein n=1 Tax=Ostreobium quekettii TaxID=121088 RepID=A0A8S1J1B1_9CHLO|nr:unnamed protein product [Ostreobium quekettii]|eukprot:evm.model.scf_145EXC.6 EVM.evm.TU.scf_145EXC.6   scf_145EXC:83401-87895(+)
MKLPLLLALVFLAAPAASAASATGSRALQQANGPAAAPAGDGREDAARQQAAAVANVQRLQQIEDVLSAAEGPAATLVQNYQVAGDDEARALAFADVWLEGNGPAIVIALETLLDMNKDDNITVLENAASGMREVERQGLGTMVSESVATGLVFVRQTSDALPMVELLKLRLNDERDTCIFVKILMQDAELMAIRLGFDFEFSRAFNAEEHTELKECFFEPCEDFGEEVTKCCSKKKSLNSGVCGCMGDKNECDFNLVFKAPRPVWVCRQEVCQAEQAVKCLCAEEEEEEKEEKDEEEEDGKEEKEDDSG